MSSQGWARFFPRLMLGLIFFMAGWYKCFQITPMDHAANYFTGPYADTWIPHFLLLVTGVTIPVLELVAGLMLIIGFRVREALLVLGGILLLVTYGHLLKEPLYDTTSHIFPRTILLMAVFLCPGKSDVLTLDYWLEKGRSQESGVRNQEEGD